MEIEVNMTYDGFEVAVYRPRKGCVLIVHGKTIEEIEEIANEEVSRRKNKLKDIPKNIRVEYEEGLRNWNFLKGYLYYDFDLSHINKIED